VKEEEVMAKDKEKAVEQYPELGTDAGGGVPARRDAFVAVPQQELPEYLQGAERGKRGFENTQKEDVLVPMLALCQSNSPQRKPDNAKYIQGLQEGDFFHSVRGTNYGPGPIYFTPIFKFDSAFRLDSDAEFECRSDDSVTCPKYGQCQSRAWSEDEKGQRVPPPCSLVKNIPVVIYGDSADDYAILGFKSTEMATFKDFFSKMKGTGKDMFAHAFELRSIPKSEGKYSWFGYQIKPAGWAPEVVFKSAEQVYLDLLEQYRQGKLKVDISGMEAPEMAPPTQAMPDRGM
jgi:hypothetical protein